MKAGWATSELTLAGLAGATICELASSAVATLPEAIVRAAACLALAWIAGRYAGSRAAVKGKTDRNISKPESFP